MDGLLGHAGPTSICIYISMHLYLYRYLYLYLYQYLHLYLHLCTSMCICIGICIRNEHASCTFHPFLIIIAERSSTSAELGSVCSATQATILLRIPRGRPAPNPCACIPALCASIPRFLLERLELGLLFWGIPVRFCICICII